MSLFSKAAVVAVVAFGGLALQSVGASAVPMVDVGPAVAAHSEAASGIIEARWHGRWGWHRPYFGYRHFGWHRHYGWHRGWRRHY